MTCAEPRATARADQPARDWLSDPQAIYRQSFATIRAESDLSALSPADAEIAVRVIHACGMTDAAADLRFHGTPPLDVTGAVRGAVAAGRPVFVDTMMTRHAILARALPRAEQLRCTLNDPGVAEAARRDGLTRSAAAIQLWEPELAGAVVVVGNAPIALFYLLERLAAGAPRPAAILAFPVGFVGAAESKDALIAANMTDIAWVTLLGRRGGSAMAGAALNGTLIGARDE
ncbi:MAG: precorrin-8X methylmutase [Pseudomonadota bacterium]